MYQKYLFVILVYSILTVIIANNDLKEKIYFTLGSDEFHMCFRMLNETHQVGCGSKRDGNVGILQLLETDADYIQLKAAPNDERYIVLMTTSFFTRDVFQVFIELKTIVGVLIDYGNASRPNHFSPDEKNPNKAFSLYNNSYLFNEFGTGLLFSDIPFAVALLTNATTIEYLRECFNKHNSGSQKGCPWCSVRMKSFMHAAVDAQICHRRSNMFHKLIPEQYCDPIGSHSLISSLGPWTEVKPADGSVILVTARMDALSMFEDLSPGFDSSMTGFVALQAVAEIMGRIKHLLEPTFNVTPIMFSLFHGESLGYMGSLRFIHDMQRGKLNVNLNISSFGTIIELGQLGVHKQMPKMDEAWLHTDKAVSPGASEEIDKLVDLLTNQGPAGVQFSKANLRFPPSSIHSFLKHYPNISAVYISNHRASFTNMYYNSFLDDNENVEVYKEGGGDDDDSLPPPPPDNFSTVTYIADVAHKVARVIYHLATGSLDYDKVPLANDTFIRDLFYCFGKSADCELFNSSGFQNLELLYAKDTFKRRYAGVLRDFGMSYDSRIHRSLLVRSLGEEVNMSHCEGEGPKINGTRYLWFKGPLNENGTRTPACYKGHILQPIAVAPIFEEEELLMKSGFPSWMESRWTHLGIDVFMQPCFAQEMKTLILGFVVVLVTLPVVFFINHRLLKSGPPSENPST